MLTVSRRRFLAGTAAAGLSGLIVPLAGAPRAAVAAPARLGIGTRQIAVAGKPATVFGITGPGGRNGVVVEAGGEFEVTLENASPEATLVHWHGLTPPWRQDGVPEVTAPLLQPGESRAYSFAVANRGTHWMHSHHGLQEQRLLAAPLIVRAAGEPRADAQDVVVMLHDFSFRAPEDILAGLRGGGMAMPQGSMAHGGHGMATGAGARDVNDVDHDAYLANDRALDDPEVVAVERSGRVRLRIINGASSTNFTIDLGALSGTLLAVDGNPVEPVAGSRFPIAIAQRLDLLVALPAEGGAFPVLALREGASERTGLILAGAGARVRKLPPLGHEAAPVLDLAFERTLKARQPLPAKARADRTHVVELTGAMTGYEWGMGGRPYGGHLVLAAREGERVEIVMRNRTEMSHPMHLHGHHFQVVGIDGTRLDGAKRDTVLVPPVGEVAIAFDADNPGKWMFHCHHLYHMAAGMMTTLEYEGIA
ncbi:MAG: multicopper oxidase family protein [Proteobacteria bacterium]|nr:multicopper oxidase family protein [Pseudomonadota bacterium]